MNGFNGAYGFNIPNRWGNQWELPGQPGSVSRLLICSMPSLEPPATSAISRRTPSSWKNQVQPIRAAHYYIIQKKRREMGEFGKRKRLKGENGEEEAAPELKIGSTMASSSSSSFSSPSLRRVRRLGPQLRRRSP